MNASPAVRILALCKTYLVGDVRVDRAVALRHYRPSGFAIIGGL